MNALYWGVEYAASFVEMLFGFIFCGAFTDRAQIKDSKPRIVSIAAIGALITVAVNKAEPFSQITSIIGVLLIIIAQYFIYHKHHFKTLVFALIYFAVIILIDFSVTYLIVYAAQLPIGVIALEHSGYRLLAITFSKSVLAVVIYAAYKITAKQTALPKRYLITLSLLSVLICVLSLVIVFKDINTDTKQLNAVSVLFFIMALGLMLILFFGAVKISDYYNNREEIALLKMKNDMLQKAMYETEKTFSLWKTSLHDYKHNIFYLKTLAENGNLDEIKTYLAGEDKLLNEKLFYYKSGNDAVDAILNVKQAIAREQGITFMLNAAMPEKVRISDSHLCVILGNLIDNAINASKREAEPYIEVSVKQIKDFLMIKVINRHTNAALRTPTLPDNKRYMHGIGLKSVRSVVREYGGEFTTAVENELFVTKVVISN